MLKKLNWKEHSRVFKLSLVSALILSFFTTVLAIIIFINTDKSTFARECRSDGNTLREESFVKIDRTRTMPVKYCEKESHIVSVDARQLLRGFIPGSQADECATGWGKVYQVWKLERRPGDNYSREVYDYLCVKDGRFQKAWGQADHNKKVYFR